MEQMSTRTMLKVLLFNVIAYWEYTDVVQFLEHGADASIKHYNYGETALNESS